MSISKSIVLFGAMLVVINCMAEGIRPLEDCGVPHLTRDKYLGFLIAELKQQDSATIDLVVSDLLYWEGVYSTDFWEAMGKDSAALEIFLKSLQPILFTAADSASMPELRSEKVVLEMVLGNQLLGDTVFPDLKQRFFTAVKQAHIHVGDTSHVFDESAVVKRVWYLVALYYNARGEEEIWAIVAELFALVPHYPNIFYCFMTKEPNTFESFLLNLESAYFTGDSKDVVGQLERRRNDAIDSLTSERIDGPYEALNARLTQCLRSLEVSLAD